jgi:hypothetical protein
VLVDEEQPAVLVLEELTDLERRGPIRRAPSASAGTESESEQGTEHMRSRGSLQLLNGASVESRVNRVSPRALPAGHG